jgi:glycogen phosphorylase
VLYPDDTTEMGRELRLKQQYFFVSASLQLPSHRVNGVSRIHTDLLKTTIFADFEAL